MSLPSDASLFRELYNYLIIFMLFQDDGEEASKEDAQNEEDSRGLCVLAIVVIMVIISMVMSILMGIHVYSRGYTESSDTVARVLHGTYLTHYVLMATAAVSGVCITFKAVPKAVGF